MNSIAFFNNKGGVGTTSLVYHTAWMFVELGYRVLAVDLDPQSTLSEMALGVDRLATLWSSDADSETLYDAVQPLFDGTGDVGSAHIEPLSDGWGLLVGDLLLSDTEDDLAIEWPRCLEGRERAFRVTTAFSRVIREAALRYRADVVLIDTGPNLGAINRAALVASRYVVSPVTADVFSLKALRNFGPALRQWRDAWRRAAPKAPPSVDVPPADRMSPLGYVRMLHQERIDRVTQVLALFKGEKELQQTYRESVLGEESPQIAFPPPDDPLQIHSINSYRNLMPLAREARKPMFALKPADGALGAYQTSVQQCGQDFRGLVQELVIRTGIAKGGAA